MNTKYRTLMLAMLATVVLCFPLALGAETPDSYNYAHVTIKEHFDARLSAMEKEQETLARLMEIRLEAMNQFRNQLKEQAGTFLTKAEYDPAHQRVIEAIHQLESFRDKLEGKASATSVIWSYALAVLSLGVAVLSFIHKRNP